MLLIKVNQDQHIQVLALIAKCFGSAAARIHKQAFRSMLSGWVLLETTAFNNKLLHFGFTLL